MIEVDLQDDCKAKCVYHEEHFEGTGSYHFCNFWSTLRRRILVSLTPKNICPTHGPIRKLERRLRG